MVILKGRSVVCISEWFGVCMARSSTAMVWGVYIDAWYSLSIQPESHGCRTRLVQVWLPLLVYF